MLLAGRRYCWIYGHGATWWHFTEADVAKYGNVGNSTLPVDERLEDFRTVLREKWTSTDRMKQISRMIREGRSDEFLRLLNFVKEFRIIGPFGHRNFGNFGAVFPPEEEIDFDADYPGAGSAGRVNWRTASVDASGYLDFLKYLSPSYWRCAYACCKIISPKAVPAHIRLGTNDTATVWLNGEKILSKNIERSAAPDSDILPVHLEKGENTVLIKVCNTEFNWGLYLRITDDKGDPLKGLIFRP